MSAVVDFMSVVKWGVPMWGWSLILVLIATDYILPRVKNPQARSLGELLANTLSKVLGKFPILGPILVAIGTPKPAPIEVPK